VGTDQPTALNGWRRTFETVSKVVGLAVLVGTLVLGVARLMFADAATVSEHHVEYRATVDRITRVESMQARQWDVLTEVRDATRDIVTELRLRRERER